MGVSASASAALRHPPGRGYRWPAALLALLLHAALLLLLQPPAPRAAPAPRPLQISVTVSSEPVPVAAMPARPVAPAAASTQPARAAPGPAAIAVVRTVAPAMADVPAAGAAADATAPASAVADAASAAPAVPAAPGNNQASGRAAAAVAEPEHLPPHYHAGYLRNPQPDYPPLSRKLREAGTTLLRVHVATDGTPDQVQIQTSSGFARLDLAAEAAVQRWRFVSARSNGQAVAGWVEVPILFKLDTQP